MTTTTAGYSGGLNIQKVQSKNAKKKKHQDDDEEEEDGPTCIVVSKSKKNSCRPLPPNVGLPRRYQIQSANKTVTVFECLLNFHYVEGDMVHHCADNFSWIGQEPLCEVDYYKSNMILSCSIGAFCTIATFLFLCGDMVKHMKKRTDTKFDRQKYKHTHFLYPRRHQRHDNDSYGRTPCYKHMRLQGEHKDFKWKVSRSHPNSRERQC